MPYTIDEVSIEGFRGINKSLKLETQKGACLLFGRNGAGKTSVLQAIEWCLTGKLPYLEGREFRYEDAIVNMFNPSKTAAVSIILKDENGKLITVTRRKKMAKSTAYGRPSLQVKIEGETLEGDDGQQKLEQILGVSPDDFPKIVYLHQEAIRDIILADPREMSQTIDRLLGTFELRELAEALDVSRTIRTEEKKLKARVEALERDKIAFVVGMRKRLNEEKETLLEKGYTSNQLAVDDVIQGIATIIKDLEKIAAQLGLSSTEIEAPKPDAKSIAETLGMIEKQLKKLDRFRVTALSQQEALRINLGNLKNQYEEAEKTLDEFKTVTPESLLQSKKEIESKLEQLQPKIDDMQERVNSLVEVKIKLNAAKQQTNLLENQIGQIEKAFGDEKQHLDSIEKFNADLLRTENQMSTFSSHAQMVSLALEILEKSKPKECPVCSQEIDYNSVAAKLKKETQTFISRNLAQLKKERDKLKATLNEIKDSLENYKGIQGKLATEKENLGAISQEIESLMKKKIGPSFNIDQAIQDSKNEMSELNKQATILSKESLALDQKFKALEANLQKLEGVQSKIREAIGSSGTGEKLIKGLDAKVNEIKDKAKSYEDTKAIDTAATKTETIKRVSAYLRSKEELDGLEKQLPQVTKLVSELKDRMEQLSILEGSLEAIRQVTVTHQKDVVTTMIGTLEELINKHYNDLTGHPFFAKLRLEPEEEHPFIYSIKGTSSDLTQSTYIPTRFSNAQMNIVALSIFLSNNLRMSGNLGLIIMDDPAQSMDDEHRKALARLIKTLSRDKQIIIATQDLEMKKALDAECKKYQIHQFGSWKPEELLFEE